VSFLANYPGGCDNCGGQVKGHECVFTMDSFLVHVTCPEVVEEPARPACPRCFMVPANNGACECDE